MCERMTNNVLITGASGGIGRAVAESLLASGSTVIGLDRIISDSIKQVCENYPGQLSLHETDLTDVSKLSDLINSG